jgi:two-component system nitrogen regulation sensor histidine kinase GlnL
VASSLAHGVRNPLNAIKGAVVYLEEKYGHEATLIEFSTIITEEISKLDNFVSNFLSAARGEMSFFPVNVNDLLGSILRVIKMRAEVQQVKISTNLSVLPLVPANLFQLEQAIFNIINNAFEALPDGGIIEIRTFMKWENDLDYVVIEITDNGKGIPTRKLESLGNLSNDSEGDVRGFGIFLSREIIKSHRGRLQWESRKEHGTTFKIYLPAGNNEQ